MTLPERSPGGEPGDGAQGDGASADGSDGPRDGATDADGSADQDGSASDGTPGDGTPGDGTPADGVSDPGDGAGGEPPDPATVVFQEDFESTGDDAVPAGFHSFVGYQVDVNNAKTNRNYALVDGTRSHGGVKALHVNSDAAPAMLTRALPEGTNALYVRVWVYMTGSLGQAPSRNHETLLGLRKSVGGAHDEVRFGEIKGVIGVNEVPSDNITPKMASWGGGPLLAANQWHCLEVGFRGDLAKHEVRAASDGSELFVVNDPSQWNNGELSPTFLDGKFVEFILGWHSFSNYANELWFDDLVVATAPVGCD